MSRDPDPPDLPEPKRREPILGQVVIWQDGQGNPVPMNHAQRRAAQAKHRRDLRKADAAAAKKAAAKWRKEERARRRRVREQLRRHQELRYGHK